MPSSAVHSFTDPDDYAAAIRATNAEINVTGRGRFTGRIIRIDLHRLWMQRFSDNLPRVGHSANMAGRAIFSFRTEPGPSLLAAGMELQPTSIVRHSERQSYHRRSSGFASYGSMSLPVEEIATVGEKMASFDLTPPRDAKLITPPLGAMKRLQRLHAAAGHLAENAPEVIANPEAARGLEQLLIHALVECLTIGEASEDRRALRHHATVMRRFRTAVEENPDRTLYLSELCAAVGASDRTLRACCQEFLGMSPMRYLWLRRMHLARRALRVADAGAATVTEIATNYGFWELGRFSVAYRSLFGESPSASLQRPPEDPRPQKIADSPWQLPEAA
jgi:AraC-like DNA-binding protein